MATRRSIEVKETLHGLIRITTWLDGKINEVDIFPDEVDQLHEDIQAVKGKIYCREAARLFGNRDSV
jgi:hypothetical protein